MEERLTAFHSCHNLNIRFWWARGKDVQGNSSLFTSVHWWVVVPREVCFSKHLNSSTTAMKTDCQAVGGGFSIIGGRLDTPIIEDLFLDQIRIEAPTFSFVLEPKPCGIAWKQGSVHTFSWQGWGKLPDRSRYCRAIRRLASPDSGYISLVSNRIYKPRDQVRSSSRK